MATRWFTLLSLSLLASACNSDDGGSTPPMMGIGPDTGPTASMSVLDVTGATNFIIPMPGSVDPRVTALFDRYSSFTAPNGRRIHFLSQAGISDDLLFRARGIVRQHLFEVENTTNGADKTAVFDAMALRGSTLALISNAAAYDPTDPDVIALEAFFGDILETIDVTEMTQEASANYLLPSPTDDVTLGQTAGFVLRQGLSATVPQFQTDLDAATDNAVMMNLFRPDVGLAADEIDDAYLELALSSYYGIWGHDPNADGTAGAAGEYDFNTRDDMVIGDPGMITVIESYFAPTHRYPAFLEESFNGTFEMAFDIVLPYTHRSRYLERAGLRGTSTARINGNELDNILIGNAESTVFEGRGGNDAIDGNGGTDTVHFTGDQVDYIRTDPDPTVIRFEDMMMNRDGIDDIRAITEAIFNGAAAVTL